ncbi:endonuclease/exonuclease/phosphatase family protein [Flavobacterium chuncheonense]|uniref:Endonuclease/exonuclease/phosphatase family protein n=1 Tax=Flavobacterium chuncheonense TaxID=2026653 RepID=A0ABW5YJE9_9FLAO
MGRLIVILLLFLSFSGFTQISLCTWNIENLGDSKSELEINYIVSKIKNYDIIAIQEVVAGYGGTQAVARIADELNRTGEKWDYKVSNPTSSSSYKTERYAYLWKTSKVKLIGTPFLEPKYNLNIDREPYFATFKYNKQEFTLVNFHAITKSMQPETEIKYFKYFFNEYPNLNLIFVGDFNCPQSHSVFNTWRKNNYFPVFVKQKTSLKKECIAQECLASEFDNIWYQRDKIEISEKKAIFFYTDFNSLQTAREISDHIPLTVKFYLK